MENMQNHTVENQSVPQMNTQNPFAVPYGAQFKPKPPKKLDLEKSDYVFFAVFAVLTLCLVFFGLFGGMAVGFTVTAIALVAVLAAYVLKNGEFTFVSVLSLVLAIASSLVFSLYTDDLLSRFIALVILLSSTALCVVSVVDDSVTDSIDGLLKLIRSVVLTPFENILLPFKALFKNDKNKTAVQIVSAVLASVPVLAVVIPLLMSADAAFEGLVGKIAENIGMTILKLGIAAILLMLLLSFASSCKYELNKLNSKPIDFEKSRKLKSPFAVTFIGIIALVYLVYMFSQTAYFFSAFSGILPAGYEFTFAQYARRGFFETEAIAFINLAIMSIIMLLSKRRENGRLNPVLKGLMTFVSVFTILFIITALSKMVMYINEYGLTVLRLFTSVFMVATAVVIIAFIIRIFNSELNTVKYAVLISMALFTVLSLCGIDRTVASYNVNAYLNGTLETVDVDTVFHLSDSAIPYLAKLTDCEDAQVKAKAQQSITHYFDIYDNWIWDDAAIRVNFSVGTDMTLSKYLTAQAINSRNIEPIRNIVFTDEGYSEEIPNVGPIGSGFTGDEE